MLSGKQKAAILLTCLDAPTAAELLKGVEARMVQELALELAYLDASGYRAGAQSIELAKEFYSQLQPKEGFELKTFLKEMLRSTVGAEKAEQIQSQLKELLQKRDPFISIRSAASQVLAQALQGEHPQAAAIVLSELMPVKSAEVLGLLAEGMRISAIARMTSSESVTPEARARVAETVCKRLQAEDSGQKIDTRVSQEQTLRKVAVILRNLNKQLRDGLLAAIQEKDKHVGETVTGLMVLWEDIPVVADRSLQDALRGIDSKKLAIALTNADEAINKKIRSNISERMSAMIDEETSLMAAPKKEAIQEAREDIVKILREVNARGDLTFIER